MLGRIAILWLMAGMAFAGDEAAEPKNYDPDEIEQTAFYRNAPVSILTAVPAPRRQEASNELKIPDALREQVRRRIHELGKAFGIEVSGHLKWEKSSDGFMVSYRSEDGCFLGAHGDLEKGQLSSVYLSGLRLEGDEQPSEAPEPFEAYARKFHRLAFGFDAPTESKGVRVKSAVSRRSIRWSVIVDGATMHEAASVSAESNDKGRWNLHGSRGPSSSEVTSFGKWLEQRPTRITEQEAVAIGWKHWKSVREAPPEDPGEYFVQCELRQGTVDDRDPWAGLRSHHHDCKAWKSTVGASEPHDPAFYEVKIRKNLFEVSALVDRVDGKIIRINQGRMNW